MMVQQYLSERLSGYITRRRIEQFLQLKFPAHIWGVDFARVEEFRIKETRNKWEFDAPVLIPEREFLLLKSRRDEEGKSLQSEILPCLPSSYSASDITGFRDSTYRTMSGTGSVQGAISLPAVREEMLDILVKDDSLRRSAQNAIEVLSSEAFVTLFKNLLQSFSYELLEEAEQKEERGAAYVFYHHASFAARSACEYWRVTEEPGMTEMLAQLPEKKRELGYALQPVAPEDGVADNDGIDERFQHSNPEDMLIHLKRLEHFITNSNAFRNLQRGLRDWTKSYCRFSFTRSSVTAIQDLCKRTIERLAGTRLSWWPLSEPEEELKANCTRVYSQSLNDPSCRKWSFYDDIPTALAEELFHELASARRLKSGSSWEILRHEAVFLEGTTLMGLLRIINRQRAPSDGRALSARGKLATKDAPDGSEQGTSSGSTVEGKQANVEIDEQNKELVETGTGSASAKPKDNRQKDPQDDRNMEPSKSRESKDLLDDSKPVLFLSLDVAMNGARACSVDVGMNDLQMMTNLRESYNDMRGSFLLQRKRPVGVKFYRFRSFYKTERYHQIHLHQDKERYPPKNDNRYDWQLWNDWQDGDLYPNGEAWYFFNNPRDCGNSTETKEKLPKLTKDEARSDKNMYGLYIEERHHVSQIVVPIVVVLGLTLGGTLWFVPPWLRSHPDDLQGATVPVTLAVNVVACILGLVVTLLLFRLNL